MTKSVLLIISGSIAACKTPDVVRRLTEQGVRVTCVLTAAGEKFVTPMTLAALSGNPVYSELFSLKDEAEMGHIRLSREHDLIAVVPASANILSSMVVGRADDLATAILLASNKPVLVAPAMNTQMWKHPATQRNVAQLQADGVVFIDPEEGMLACGETGQGRLAEVDAIVAAIVEKLSPSLSLPLKVEGHPSPFRERAGGEGMLHGLSALVTSGPTFEPLDPVRFIGNRSSGKQGHAIAEALARAGANVTLVSGPVALPSPAGVQVVHVETAEEMLTACKKALPVEVAICAAAVSDWRAKKTLAHKLKKRANQSPPAFELAANPDILKTLSASGRQRPALVVGFAAETESLKKHATEKLRTKGCDWIIANDVSGNKVFGKDSTSAHLITTEGMASWSNITKQELADKLVERIQSFFSKENIHGKRRHRNTAPRG